MPRIALEAPSIPRATPHGPEKKRLLSQLPAAKVDAVVHRGRPVMGRCDFLSPGSLLLQRWSAFLHYFLKLELAKRMDRRAWRKYRYDLVARLALPPRGLDCEPPCAT